MYHTQPGGRHHADCFTIPLSVPQVWVRVDSTDPHFTETLSELQASLLVTREACIYCLIDPNTIDVRYVGQTRSPIRRWAAHCRFSHGTDLWNWIRSLKEQGQRPRFWVVDRAPRHQIDQRERQWIQWARTKYSLLNVR